MEQYKKKTISLIIASVVAVTGAFGAESYKNSLMSLDFKDGADGAVEMTLHTKRGYSGTISPKKTDATTYVIMLPEVNSTIQNPSAITGSGIDDVSIRTMPYTNSSNGYTKITIKTSSGTTLNTVNKVYVPEKSTTEETKFNENPPAVNVTNKTHNTTNTANSVHNNSAPRQVNTTPVSRPTVTESTNTPQKKKIEPEPIEVKTPEVAQNDFNTMDTYRQDNGIEVLLLIMGVIIIISAITYIFISQKNKMAEILGEQADFDLSSETKKSKKIKKTIRDLDKMYKKPMTMPKKSEYDISNEDNDNNIYTPNVDTPSYSETEEEPNIVDLDELFQEKTNSTENNSNEDNFENIVVDIENQEPEEIPAEENNILDDFLNSFLTDEPQEIENEEDNAPLYNEELYNRFLNNDKLRFTKDDINQINQLLNTEIDDDTIRNIDKYLVTNPIKKEKTPQEILENFVTAYTVNQHITFSSEDINALNKLISIEVTPDFLNDIKMNPEQLKQKQEELEQSREISHKTSEILTLNVRDLLPDLSEALKNQGGKRIESEVVPEVVYFSEGYDYSTLTIDANDLLPDLSEEVKKQGGKKIESDAKPEIIYYSEGYDYNTLSLDMDMPDLSKEINNKDAFKHKESEEIQYAVSGYEVESVSVKDMLPDLTDVMKNPKKYENKEPEVDVKANEDALLKSIMDVKFKPFFEDNNDKKQEVPSLKEAYTNEEDMDLERLFNEESIMPEEIKETIVPEEIKPEPISPDTINLDEIILPPSGILPQKEQKEQNEQKETTKKTVNTQKKSVKITKKRSAEAEKLLQLIQDKKEQKPQNIVNKPNNKPVEKEPITEQKKDIPGICIIEGEEYEILDDIKFSVSSGCYLAKKDNKYCVLGYIITHLYPLKTFETAKFGAFSARKSESFADGSSRYLIRFGKNKFIINVTPNSMEYIMDLC